MADARHVKQEKAKAQDLRHSRWWQQQLAHARCYYCHVSLAPENVTMDHIVPVSDGGKSVKSNVVMCCKDCNNRKKDASLVDWALRNA